VFVKKIFKGGISVVRSPFSVVRLPFSVHGHGPRSRLTVMMRRIALCILTKGQSPFESPNVGQGFSLAKRICNPEGLPYNRGDEGLSAFGVSASRFPLILLVIALSLHPAPLENIPTESWVYDYIDYLKTSCLIQTVPATSKPWTRKETALIVKEALDKYPLGGPRPAQDFLFQLARELSDELKALNYESKSNRSPLLSLKIADKFGEERLALENDWFGKIQVDTSNKSLSIGTVLKTGHDRLAIYDRFEFTLYQETIPDISDSAGTHVPGFSVHSWMNIGTFVIKNAYLNYKIPWFTLQLGRDKLSFGPGKRKSMMLSDSAPALDAIQLKGDFRNLKYLAFTAALSNWGEKLRFLSGQRLELSLFNRMRFGGSMFVVHSPCSSQTKSFFGLINPLIPLYFEEANSGHDDNFLVGWDIVGYFPKTQVYGQLFLDNWEPLPSRRQKFPNSYCLKLGFYAVPIPWFDLCAEYNKITYYTYYHRIYHIAYTHYEVPLGNPLGPDADDTYCRLNFYPVRFLYPSFQINLKRRGERNRGDFKNKAYSNPDSTPVSKVFPTGIVESTLSFGPELTLYFLPDLKIIASGQYYKINNPNGIDTIPPRQALQASLTIQYRY